MLVTIQTDASFDGDLNIGAYAFYLRSNLGAIQSDGAFKNPVYSSTMAELASITNAIAKLASIEHWKADVKRIIINTDSKGCIAMIKHRKAHKHCNDILNAYFTVLKLFPNKLTVDPRHVKAHSGKGTKRQFINDACDVRAKAQLNTRRKAVTQ